jgi:hypothetical protein
MNNKQLFTREDYMSNKCTHQEYYRQFIFPAIKSYVQSKYSKEFLKKCYEEDKNLNNIGDDWFNKFDQFSEAHKEQIAKINTEINGKSTYSLCIGTCAIKAYMNEYINEI